MGKAELVGNTVLVRFPGGKAVTIEKAGKKLGRGNMSSTGTHSGGQMSRAQLCAEAERGKVMGERRKQQGL